MPSRVNAIDVEVQHPSPGAYGHLAAATVFLVIGAAGAFSLHAGIRPAIQPMVWLMIAIGLWGGFVPRATRLNLLPRMMLLVYAMPFSTLLGYLLYQDYLWVFTPHGYLIGQDPEVMSILTLTGLVGLCGFVGGMHAGAAARRPESTPVKTDRSQAYALGKVMFAALLLVALGLSLLSAMPETLFQTAYSVHADPIANKVNFNAAFLVSYVMFVVLWIDIEREADPVTRKWKVIGLGLAFAYVVVSLQILRGDRDSAGLIAAFAALYLTSPRADGSLPSRRVTRMRLRRLIAPLALLVTVFIALGKAREDVLEVSSRLSFGQLVRLGFSQNTWTAVLWTNLGTAWEYDQGMINYRYGSTYRDYALSLPPGFITRAYGYERPLETTTGLAHEDPAGVSMGGLHAVITPFKNFGAWGVLALLFLYALGMSWAERASSTYRFMPRVLWGAIFCAGFLWFWYGDMPIIRSLMAAVVVALLYRLATSVRYVFRYGEQHAGTGLVNRPTSY